MGVEYMERCSRGCPCVFCGDVGLDIRMHYPASEDVVHWCHKVRAKKGDHVIGRDGREYYCISESKETEEATMGEFSLYKPYLTDEEWKEKQRRINPDWKPGSKAGYKPAKTFRADELYRESARSEGELLPREARLLTARELDERYRAILNALVLEDWHRDTLLKDWKNPVNDVSRLLKDFPIRSLPPTDRERFSESGKKIRYKNPTRKSLVTHLYDRFGGALAGTPGLYERDGEIWASKPQRERWTIAAQKGGILFPCYDKDGLIYRLRLKIDNPDLVIKQGKDDPFEGGYGYFSWQLDSLGNQKCFFVPDEGGWKARREVDESLARGKSRGKYVNFSSFHEQLVDGKVQNSMLGGSQSGSPYGLYRLDDCPLDDLAILTEGEKKAMVSCAICGCAAVSIPGVSSFNVIFKSEEDGKSLFEKLREDGVETFVLCYDADKDSNESVLKAEQKFAEALKARGANVMIGSWSSKYDKGLDDLLILGVRPTLREYVGSEESES